MYYEDELEYFRVQFVPPPLLLLICEMHDAAFPIQQYNHKLLINARRSQCSCDKLEL